ncbi:MAG TPA: serine hydrolase domain-containing protein [Flavilitoribacter sp.]|nr:serine hydrolase domain-containing protein [Flavilitoribacter sp.]
MKLIVKSARRLLGCMLLVSLFSCRDSLNVENGGSAPEETLRQYIDEVVSGNDQIQGMMVHLESPALGLSWSGASGVSDIKTGAELRPEQPFRIASVTKTFVAASILRLFEEGKLSLDDPITKYISAEHAGILTNGGYQPEAITVRHLLTHTSGLFDYALGSQVYATKVKNDPGHRWTRTEQLQGAMEWGRPYAPPGKEFHYSDTGYILLGEIIEKLTDKSLALGIRDLLDFSRLGLSNTWLESLEEAPPGIPDRAHQYLNDADIYDWDPSCDLYGGGGLASTTSDIARFYYQLFNGKVFSQPSTLDTMLEKTKFPEGQQPSKQDYRMGIELINIYGTDAYMHTGYWGVQAVYLPKYDTAIVINFITGGNIFIIKKIISMVDSMHSGKQEAGNS